MGVFYSCTLYTRSFRSLVADPEKIKSLASLVIEVSASGFLDLLVWCYLPKVCSFRTSVGIKVRRMQPVVRWQMYKNITVQNVSISASIEVDVYRVRRV